MNQSFAYLNRMPVESWDQLRQNALWSTHLNNIRMIVSDQRSADWQRTLVRELKLLCLFHDRSIVLSDSDLLNSPAFQGVFTTNFQSIRSAFAARLLIPAIRDTAGGLSEVNAQQGPRRADPKMAELAVPFARDFDRFFRASGLGRHRVAAGP